MMTVFSVRSARPVVAATATLVAAAVTGHAQAQTCADHGVPVDGFPAWQERATLVLTNAVRIAPTQYRDTYLPPIAATILQSTTYPAVAPLQYSSGLNHSARAHSVDLAFTSPCGFQHNSCNGTSWSSRIASFYPNYRALGENIAAGQADPLAAMSAWLLDASGGIPAADGAPSDGHRRSIMSSNFTEIGVGYANGPNAYHRYWTQDFGRPAAATTACSPIAAGSHILQSGNTVFLVNYYDANNQPPQSASIVIGSVTSPMTVHLGIAARGTYRLLTTRATSCRSYHFEFRDSAGTMRRYPARGELRSTGEGNCTEEYIASTTPPPCVADFNGSNTVSVQDLFEFLGAYFSANTRADINQSGGAPTVQDIFDFVAAYFRGC